MDGQEAAQITVTGNGNCFMVYLLFLHAVLSARNLQSKRKGGLSHSISVSDGRSVLSHTHTLRAMCGLCCFWCGEGLLHDRESHQQRPGVEPRGQNVRTKVLKSLPLSRGKGSGFQSSIGINERNLTAPITPMPHIKILLLLNCFLFPHT